MASMGQFRQLSTPRNNKDSEEIGLNGHTTIYGDEKSDG